MMNETQLQITYSRRLVATINRIIDAPGSWKQRSYHGSNFACGTAHCFAGHADILAGYWDEAAHADTARVFNTARRLVAEGHIMEAAEIESIPHRAALYLGLTGEERDWAFAAARDFPELYRFVEIKAQRPGPIPLQKLREIEAGATLAPPLRNYPEEYPRLRVRPGAYVRAFFSYLRGGV